jgi:hypothetical protein
MILRYGSRSIPEINRNDILIRSSSMDKQRRMGVTLPHKLCKLIEKECEDNGWMFSIPVKIGLECYLSATHEQRIELLKKFNKRIKES